MSHLALVDGRYKLDLNAPHTVYKNAAGKRVPGVTTILSVLDKPALLEWAAREERAMLLDFARSPEAVFGNDLMWQQIAAAPYAYAVKRDTAADLGTIVHARIHAWLQGSELDPEGIPAELYEKSVHGWQRFRDEWNKRGLTMIQSEYAMVDERTQTGGTCDIVALDSEHWRHLIDIKTTNAHPKWPWDEAIAQVAQYAEMYSPDDYGPKSDMIHRVDLVRVGKSEDDGVQWVTLTNEQRAHGLALFKGALLAYRAKRELERNR